ncbi:MAG: tRNA (adenosine(37)-N6)-threonylcarbamoyltransferase complex ATPase subunit type 1 TsaE [Gammaproteobacteria bacterium]
MTAMTLVLPDEAATERLGQQFADLLKPISSALIKLQGDLGAGKTCFTRSLIQAAGYQDRVKSPTYALVEAYSLQEKMFYHFDLYRLQGQALEMIGIRDYLAEQAICLIEWPERAANLLPAGDIQLHFFIQDSGRRVEIMAFSPLGEHLLAQLEIK